MAEGEMHKHLKDRALYFLKEKVTDLVANEVKFYNAYSVADAVGINLKRQEVRVIECKATKGDFKRDTKLSGSKTSYYLHAHYSYIMCPTDVIDVKDIPHGYGLLYLDEYDVITVVKKPVKNTSRLKTMFKTSLKNTCRALTNDKLYSTENKDSYDVTGNKFGRGAEIKYIRIRCPHCKKYVKDLVKEGVTTTLKCSKCKGDIEIGKGKIREITAYNKTFIKRINKLNDTE